MFMMNVRNVLIGLIASAVLAGIVVSCGGGSGGYDNTPAAAAPTYTVGGNITGNTVPVTLKLNGGNDTPMAAAGAFTFSTALANDSPFNVQVVDASDRCTVSNGAGKINAANITNVAVTCGAQAAQMVVRSAILNGAQQNPAVVTNGKGVGGVIVDPTTKAITGGITFSGLSGPPTTGGHHIHQTLPGDPTGNGNVIIGLTLASDGRTAVVPPGTTLTQTQYDALLAGELYFNVHTVAHSGGEIRGQINAQGGVLAAVANLDKDHEVDANGATNSTSTATGQGTLLADAATRAIIVSYITHNVANATMAHIHTSQGPATIGLVRVGFGNIDANAFGAGSNLASPAQGIPPMTTQDVVDFGISYLYFNVHSSNSLCNPPPPLSACSAGEIRGNITPIP
jgi:hypothetical protein